MKTLLKITGFFAWLFVIYLVSTFNPIAAYGLAALTIWAMIPNRVIRRL